MTNSEQDSFLSTRYQIALSSKYLLAPTVPMNIGVKAPGQAQGTDLYYMPHGLANSDATEANAQIPCPSDIAALDWYINVLATTDGDAVITLRLNAADTALKQTVPTGTTGVIHMAKGVAVKIAPGDLIDIEVDLTAGSSGALVFDLAVVVAPQF